jgi:hypothetical protein
MFGTVCSTYLQLFLADPADKRLILEIVDDALAQHALAQAGGHLASLLLIHLHYNVLMKVLLRVKYFGFGSWRSCPNTKKILSLRVVRFSSDFFIIEFVENV